MTINPIVEHVEELATPQNQAIGFVNTKAQLDAVITALSTAGYPESSIIVLHGENSEELLERLKKTFHFADGEDALLDFATRELVAGHYALGIYAKDRESAVRIANLTQPLGAHSFSYFGTWVNERMTR